MNGDTDRSLLVPAITKRIASAIVCPLENDVIDEYWYPLVQIGRIADRYFDIAIAVSDFLKGGMRRSSVPRHRSPRGILNP